MLDDTYLCWTTAEFVQLRDKACAQWREWSKNKLRYIYLQWPVTCTFTL